MNSIAVGLCVFFSMNLIAQVKIGGTIVSHTEEPISFVKVILLEPDSTIKAGTTADLQGKFELQVEPGSYILQVREVSETVYSQPLNVTEGIDLGTIKTKVHNQELGEVEVSVKKQLILRKVDRLIFNVENSIAANGGDALDALRITPGVKVQNDVISILGKSAVRVMVNDRLIQLSNDDLVNFLKTISSDNISKIEVITTPPAQYAADGNSGIINIVLINAKRDRWNAGVGASAAQRTFLGGAINGNFNFNQHKFSLQTSLSLGNSTKEILDRSNTFYSTEVWSARSPRKVDYDYSSVQAALDYKFNSKWNAGIQYMGSFSEVEIGGNSLTKRTDANDGSMISQIQSTSASKEKPSMHSGNVHAIFTPDSLNTKISFDADYFTFQSAENRTFSGNYLDASSNILSGSYFAMLSGNMNRLENYSGRIDVEVPRKWGVLSFGTKYSQSETNNAFKLYNTSTGQAVLDKNQSNTFNYLEKNGALYVSFSKELNKKWSIQAGLRSELTETKGYSANYDQTAINNYNKFFPTTYVSYTPNENHSYSASYGRRINRPNYEQLNPFRWYDSPFVYGEGNPFLNPSFSDNFEINHSFKNINTNIFFSLMTNGFDQFGVVNPQTNTTNYLVLNFYDSRTMGISESYVFEKWKWWTSTNTFDLSYSVTTSDFTSAQLRSEGFQSSISTDNSFVLNKKKTLQLNVNYWQSFRGVWNVLTFLPASSFSASLKYAMLDNKLQFTLSATDVFKKNIFRAESLSNGIRQKYANYYDNRMVRFSVRYTFGSKLLNIQKNKFGNEEEQNRVGN